MNELLKQLSRIQDFDPNKVLVREHMVLGRKTITISHARTGIYSGPRHQVNKIMIAILFFTVKKLWTKVMIQPEE